MHKRECSDRLAVAVKRQGVNVNRRVVDAQELAVTNVAIGSIRGSSGPKLEERSKAGGHREGDAVRVVDGDAFQVFALAEAIYEALQTLVRELLVELRLDRFLEAFGENFRAARDVIAQNAAFGTDLVSGEKQRHH